MYLQNHTIHTFKLAAESQLAQIYGEREAAALVTRWLSYRLNLSGSSLILNKHQEISGELIYLLELDYNRLLAYEPLQYILGEVSFYDLTLKVNPSVLIPRPETEELIYLMINQYKNKLPFSVLDIGTGSGCIALALAKTWQQSQVYALEYSAKALHTATLNANINQLKVQFIQANILTIGALQLPKVDIIVSNPPYVPQSRAHRLANNVIKYEPWLALFVNDENSLLFYEAICKIATKILNPGGGLFFECDEQTAEGVYHLLILHHFMQVELKKDINGFARFVYGFLAI